LKKKTDYKKFALLKAVETDLTQAIRNILKSQGVDGDSDLIKSVGVTYNQDLFQILANDYYWYVSTGRKPHTKKVPISALIQWIKDKNISYTGSINSAAFAIQESIYKSGIRGLLFKDAVVDFSVKALSSITPETLAEMVVVEIVKEFTKSRAGKTVPIGYTVKIRTKNITLG